MLRFYQWEMALVPMVTVMNEKGPVTVETAWMRNYRLLWRYGVLWGRLWLETAETHLHQLILSVLIGDPTFKTSNPDHDTLSYWILCGCSVLFIATWNTFSELFQLFQTFHTCTDLFPLAFPFSFSHSQLYRHCLTLTVCVMDCGKMDWQMPPSGLPTVSAV